MRSSLNPYLDSLKDRSLWDDSRPYFPLHTHCSCGKEYLRAGDSHHHNKCEHPLCKEFWEKLNNE